MQYIYSALEIYRTGQAFIDATRWYWQNEDLYKLYFVSGGGNGSANDGKGKLSGKLDGLTQAERKMVNDLINQGKNVEIIPKDPVAKLKTPDFKINTVPTELKTIANPNVNTVITKIQNGFQQNAERVLIDARNSGLTMQQAQQAIIRTVGSYKNNVPGDIEIWYSDGVITYP